MRKNSSPTGSEAKLTFQVRRTRFVLGFEQLWNALWPASGIAAAFVAAALLGIFADLPGWLHAGLLLLSLFALCLALFTGFRGFRLAQLPEAARRLERDNALAHRPLSALQDSLAAGGGDHLAEELWAAHQAHLQAHLTGIKNSQARPDLAARDPHGLRFVALAFLLIALSLAGQNWRMHLSDALTPLIGTGPQQAKLDAWIDPPAYTGQPPLSMNAQSRTIRAPQGAKVQLRVHHANSRPRLSISPAGLALKDFSGEKGEYAAQVTVQENSRLHVRVDRQSLADWRIEITPDTAPIIGFAEAPQKTPQNALKIAFKAKDDYGLREIRARITPKDKKGKALSLDLPVQSGKDISQTIYRDLTDHPYAGMLVEIVLEAKDAAGQVGHSKAATLKLPARLFTNPLSRALIEQRARLAAGEDKVQDDVAAALDALTLSPQHFYKNKSGVYLAIRAARWAAKTARRAEDFRRSESLMWQTALAIEQGGLSLAAAELRRLQQAIQDALGRGALQDEIDALLQRYREALQRYMRFMAQNAQPGGASPSPNAKMLRPEDLETLLKAIEQLSQSGARGEAAQMLAMLQGLLENLQMSSTQSGKGDGAGQSAQDKQLSDAIGKLGALMGDQRALLDKTLRAQQGAGGAQGLARQQGELSERLQKLEEDLAKTKEAAPALKDARRAMEEARRQLQKGALGPASAHEQTALENLRSSADKLAKDLMRRSGQPGQMGEQDPLGRDSGGNGPQFGNQVKVPDQMTLERARNILKELRRRAGERGRPKDELDYIERLLKEF